MSIRIIVDPVRDPAVTTHARIRGARLRMTGLGEGPTRAMLGVSTPARLTFLIAAVDDARSTTTRDFEAFASVEGSVTLEGPGGAPVFFNVVDNSTGPATIQYTDDPANEDPALPRQRLELDFDPVSFRDMLDLEQTNAVLLLPTQTTSSRQFLELAVSLEVAGTAEAPPEANDILDIDVHLPLPRVVVIDPGHGGTTTVGGSSPNNAHSPSGVLEKNMTLDLAQRVETAIATKPHPPRVILTRTTDVNLGLAARANVARDNNAQLFLSIHFNGLDGVARGVVTLVSPAAVNFNLAEDIAFAQRIQDGVFRIVSRHDTGTRDRGVVQQALGVLRDNRLGNTRANHPCRACLAEIEFIDVPAVDRLLNLNANADTVKDEIADAIADAIMDELGF